MHMFYCPEVQTGTREISLGEEESFHCSKVLRLQAGEKILLTDGNGMLFDSTLTHPDKKNCRVLIVNSREGSDKRNYRLHIAIAPTKQTERFEWFLEKSTELGIDEITPIICEHSERRILKTERLKKILVSAMKQSGRSFLPRLNEPVRFENLFINTFNGMRFIAHCVKTGNPHFKNEYKQGMNAMVLIGPEGDFSEKEIEFALKMKAEAISLGNERLRTETAGVFVCSVVNLVNEV